MATPKSMVTLQSDHDGYNHLLGQKVQIVTMAPADKIDGIHTLILEGILDKEDEGFVVLTDMHSLNTRYDSIVDSILPSLSSPYAIIEKTNIVSLYQPPEPKNKGDGEGNGKSQQDGNNR
jgi:hypothetical protein